MRPLAVVALALPFVTCADYHSAGLFDKIDTTLAAGKSAAALAVGDLDGDGRGDVVVVDTSNQVNVLISKGDGTFATGVSYPVPNQGSRGVLVADLNGDGHADVLVANIDQDNVSVFINQGDGRLVQTQQQTMAVGCRPANMVLYDMNADGRPDLVVGCGAQPNEIHVVKNMGQSPGQSTMPNFSFGGTYTHQITTAASPSNPPAIHGIVVGELNGSGTPDIGVATDTDLRILNDPKENGRDYKDYLVSVPLAMTPVAIGIGDVNGNRINDVSALVDNGSTVQVFEYATGGTYNQLVVYGNLNAAGFVPTHTLAEVDMSSDGRSDYVLTGSDPSSGIIRLLLSGGETGVIPMPTLASYAYPNNVASPLQMCDGCLSLGDVNGDRKPDLVLRSGTSFSVVMSASR
jgi:hypothetical protein